MWTGGDWTQISRRHESAAQALAEAIDIQPGERLLEVAAGDGNLAIRAAAAGARVVATDFCSSMVKKGAARSASAGLDIRWIEADMDLLPFDDGIFNIAGAVFGIPFAPDPGRAVGQMFRVTTSGGKIALVNWASDGWAASAGEIMQSYLPNRPAVKSGTPDYGSEEGLSSLIGPYSGSIRMGRGHVWSDFPSAEAWLQEWESCMPSMVALHAMLDGSGRRSLGNDLMESVKKANVGDSGRIRWCSDYIWVVAKKGVASSRQVG